MPGFKDTGVSLLGGGGGSPMVRGGGGGSPMVREDGRGCAAGWRGRFLMWCTFWWCHMTSTQCHMTLFGCQKLFTLELL